MKTALGKLWVIGLMLSSWNRPLNAQLVTTNEANVRVTNIFINDWGMESRELQVTASGITREKSGSTNAFACFMQLTFTGGEVARCAGIRKLSVNCAKGDNGQDFRINERSIYWWDNDHVAALTMLGMPRYRATKWLPLETSSTDAKFIHSLEGEAELFNPSTANGGLVEFKDFTMRPGETLTDPAWVGCGVKLVFLGCVNGEAKHKEWADQRALLMQNMPSRRMAETINDSFLFSVEDLENRVVSMDFFDKQGQGLPAGRMVAWGKDSKPVKNLQLYCFEQPPPTDCVMRVKLATPQSLRRIKFKVENIPLPSG